MVILPGSWIPVILYLCKSACLFSRVLQLLSVNWSKTWIFLLEWQQKHESQIFFFYSLVWVYSIIRLLIEILRENQRLSHFISNFYFCQLSSPLSPPFHLFVFVFRILTNKNSSSNVSNLFIPQANISVCPLCAQVCGR